MIKVKNRIEFLYNVKERISKNPICVEVGVLSGDFSKDILSILNPEKLTLVDPWFIGYDKNGGAQTYDWGLETSYSTNDNLKEVLGRFENEIKYGQVIINRNFSYDAVGQFDDHSFDFIYIDACHLYDCVLSDLESYMLKLKPGGLLCGHDYFDFSSFGVVRAVNEFCEKHNFKMIIHNEDPLSSHLPITERKDLGDFALIKL